MPLKSIYRMRRRFKPREPAPMLTSRRQLIFLLILVMGGATFTWFYISKMEEPIEDSRDYPTGDELPVMVMTGSQTPRRRPLLYCQGIFNNDSHTMTLARQFMKTHPRHAISNAGYLSLLRNCDRFIKLRGYTTHAMTQEEADFPLAYSISMYKDVEQVERLLRAIYMPQNIYCIHVDKKSPARVYYVMRKITSCFPNVFMATRLERVTWATISVLQSDLNCLKDLLQYKRWKYYINLTGQEMPLKSNRELVRILKAYRGANEVEGYIDKHFTIRTKYVYVGGITRTNRRKSSPPHGVRMTHGAVHVIISRDFAEYSINNKVAKDLKEWLSDTMIPDESFFSSLNSSPHLNIPDSYTGYPTKDDKIKPFLVRYKLWKRYSTCKGYFQREVCIFSIGDLPEMVGRNEFFLNKFELNYDYLALDCAEELIYNKTLASAQSNFSYDTTFYENLAHVRNHVVL